MTMGESNNIETILEEILEGYVPKTFDFNLKGATNSANYLSEMYHGLHSSGT